jgi:hypothetical protein
MATFEDIAKVEKDYPKLGDDILQFFQYEHLQPAQARIAKGFHDFAEQVVRHLPQCPERTVALRKLLESKDAAVRATLWKPAS